MGSLPFPLSWLVLALLRRGGETEGIAAISTPIVLSYCNVKLGKLPELKKF